jgi:hypothetical protein
VIKDALTSNDEKFMPAYQIFVQYVKFEIVYSIYFSPRRHQPERANPTAIFLNSHSQHKSNIVLSTLAVRVSFPSLGNDTSFFQIINYQNQWVLMVAVNTFDIYSRFSH